MDNKEKVLYISDLDGTLLNKNEQTTSFTNNVINALVEKGMCFSYATARSYVTSSKATNGLKAKFPVIVYNGAFILDNETEEIILSNFFESSEVAEIRDILTSNHVRPIVYSFMDNQEKFSYEVATLTAGMKTFIHSRKGDKRDHPVSDLEKLFAGNIFYFTCIDTPEKLMPIYQQMKGRFNCIYHQDIYSGDQWLEILPAKATKANAILQLKKLLGCTKIVSFGDGVNDISMFEISDECYAVANAVDELKAIATGIIASNDTDGVAKWFLENVR